MKRVLFVVALVAGAGAGFALYRILAHGVSARDEPTAAEVVIARALRHAAIPRAARAARNPLPGTPELLAEARAHFADHCASCHGNDGRGQTELGQGLYPKPPDMTLPETQSLSDGEIFYVIENGVRLTGMPAWGRGTADDTGDTWKLVHFIRHLPRLTPEELAEMRDLNPMSRRQLEQERQLETFLEGGEAPRPAAHNH